MVIQTSIMLTTLLHDIVIPILNWPTKGYIYIHIYIYINTTSVMYSILDINDLYKPRLNMNCPSNKYGNE